MDSPGRLDPRRRALRDAAARQPGPAVLLGQHLRDRRPARHRGRRRAQGRALARRAPRLAVVAAGRRASRRAIASDAGGLVGPYVEEAFGKRLPYLLKVLSAAQPLSLQVHPDAEQAAAGFADEESRGVPQDAANRRYRDPFHKPEMVVALTPFDALCGLRDPALTLLLLGALEVEHPAWSHLLDLLSAADSSGRPARRRELAAGRRRAAAVAGAGGRSGRGEQRPTGPSSLPQRRWLTRTRTTRGCWSRCCSTGSAGAGRGPLPAGGQHPRVPAGHGHRGDGVLRQRVARWADAEARRRRGADAHHRLHAASDPGRGAGARRADRGLPAGGR